MPIRDVTRQCISALLLYFDRPHGYYLHDPHARRRPAAAVVRRGWFDDGHPVDLWDFERWQMVDMNGVEQGLVVQNLHARHAGARAGRPSVLAAARAASRWAARRLERLGGTGPRGRRSASPSTACRRTRRSAPAS